MKTYNSLGKTGFVLEHIFWALIAWIWYKNILFRCLTSHSFRESKLILCGIIALSCIAGFLTEMRARRNAVSIFFNLLCGYGIYTVLTYFQIRKTLIIIYLVMAAALSVIYAVFAIIREIKNTGQVLRGPVIHTSLMAQRLMEAGLALIMVVSRINLLFGSTIIRSGVSSGTQASMNEQSLSNNMETVILLHEDTWETLTVKERLDVLQTIANIEQRYLGLPNELNVGAANLSSVVAGYYSDNTHEIVINMDSLLSAPRGRCLTPFATKRITVTSTVW